MATDVWPALVVEIRTLTHVDLRRGEAWRRQPAGEPGTIQIRKFVGTRGSSVKDQIGEPGMGMGGMGR